MDTKDTMQMEQMKSLRKERGNILSVFTRTENCIRDMMLNCEAVSVVEMKMGLMKETFCKFKEKHDEYVGIVKIAGNVDELQHTNTYYLQIENRYDMLKSDVALWEESDVLLQPRTAFKDTEIEFCDSVSQSGSKVSSNVSSRAKDMAKKAALKIRAEALKKQQEIKLKQIELEQRNERLALETEIAVVEAEESALAECASYAGSQRKTRTQVKSVKSETIPFTDTFSTKQDIRTSHIHNTPDSEVKSKASTFQGPVVNPPENVHYDKGKYQSENFKDQGFKNALSHFKMTDGGSSRNIDQCMVEMQRQMLNVMQLPKTELMKFNGDPLKYWVFIRAFDNSVEGTGITDSVKLNRLFQYCTESALEIIECCSVMEPEKGYYEARKLLHERYGNQYVISKAWIQKVTEGPCIKYGDNVALQKYADSVRSCVVSLSAMGRLNEVDHQIRMSQIVERLPSYLQTRWRTEAVRYLKANGCYPDINQLVHFIHMAAEEANDPVFGAMSSVKDTRGKGPMNYAKTNSRTASFNVQAAANRSSRSSKNSQPNVSKYPPCKYCSGDHAIYTCQQFKALNIDRRRNFVKVNRLCFNCFLPDHMSYECTKVSMCGINGCNKRHSRLLHMRERDTTETLVKSPVQDKVNEVLDCGVNNNLCGVTGAGPSRIALPIVPVSVKIKDRDNYITTHALLDSGSTHSFCSQSLANQLGLQGTKSFLSLTTLTAENCKSSTSLVSLDVTDVQGKHRMNLPHVFVIPKMPLLQSNLATQEDIIKWPHLSDIHLPTSAFTSVELLIGQDVPAALTPLEVRSGLKNQPYATRTAFGWALNGPICDGKHTTAISYFAQADQLQAQIERFWKIDVCESEEPQLSVDDKKAIDIWNDTIVLKDGHYEMSIPFRNRSSNLPNNYCVAEFRLETLKRKLLKNESLFEKYKQGIQELLDKGYAEKLTKSDIAQSNQPIWYLPHHGVTNENKPGKLRIVFDCSAKFAEKSLNDVVLQGPDLTNKLIGVLLRFRQDQIAVMGDIEGMFHQVKVTPKDRDVLRFLWWRNGDVHQEPEIFRMTVHLFGGVWSPSCASFAVKHTAEDNINDFEPLTIQTVLEDFYVDDCLRSVNSKEKVIRLIQELNELLHRGGFKMTKWVSNSKDVLQTVPEERRAKELIGVDLNSNTLPLERALGVRWDTSSDTFGFKISIKEKPSTRRGLMSVISSIFDPFGFVCPVILKAKVLFQDECRARKGWDEPIDKENEEKWLTWKEGLPQIENFKENRCLIPKDFGEVKVCQIHIFSDASTTGYGAVAYLRIINDYGKIHCAFLMGKSRLAPIKELTIPRLELSAAVIAVKLDQMMRRELRINIDGSTFWSDSMVVLQYIKNESKRFKTFVANRVATILTGSSANDWRYVESKNNPADDASRGLHPQELIGNSRWRNGPGFLWEQPSSWPSMPKVPDVLDSDKEVKQLSKANLTVNASQSSACNRLIEMHSSWYKLKVSTAWILRLKQCLRDRVQGQRSKIQIIPLTVAEMHQAEVELVKFVQRNSFGEELQDLKKSRNQTVKRKSSIFNLEPMTNSDGVLCIRGRLSAAPISVQAKHQMILPKDSHLVTLIVRHNHKVLGHSGTEHLLSYIRMKFWIVKGRSTIKKILRNCVHCKRRQSPLGSQRMADLPEERVTSGKPPFTYTGVDCFGPFLIKRGRVQLKRYGCLFTCLTTRAIHIEKLDSMDTDSFINALRRFESRRGKPEMIRSDNGSNFRSGERELRQSISLWNQKQIQEHMRQRDIQWVFNPPTASHMGGVWERLIRTVRKVMNSMLYGECLSDEVLETLFCEIEAIVNSRPITAQSDNPLDAESLTPNHLLLLRSGPELPPGLFSKQDTYRKRWKQVQFLADTFWRRWLREYLPTLQLRQKWLKASRNFRPGDIVMIMDENTHRNQWPLGRITQAFPGGDGLVRVAELSSRGKLLRRPVHKLCLLEEARE